jgi:uncharacterized protein YkwD
MIRICLISLLTILSSFYSFSIDTLKVEKAIFNEINSYRVKIGKSSLKYATQSVQSCRKHSLVMGKSGKLQHVASLSKVNALAEIIQLNYTLGRTENEKALDILDIFIDSEPHKKIIESNYKDISVGVFITSEDDIWVTVRFY